MATFDCRFPEKKSLQIFFFEAETQFHNHPADGDVGFGKKEIKSHVFFSRDLEAATMNQIYIFL